MENKINYIWEAFKRGGNILFILAGLGAVIAPKIPARPAFILFAGLEILYLTIFSNNKRFRRIIRSKVEGQKRKEDLKRRESDLFRMNYNEHRKRYLELRKMVESIRANYKRQASGGAANFVDQSIKGLEELQDQFLKLIFSLITMNKYLDENTSDKLEADIAKLQKEIQNDSENVKNIKEQRIEILKKRRDKISSALENKKVITNQLDMIEETAKYLLEESMTIKDPDILSQKIEAVTRDAEVASQSISEMESFINMTNSITESDILNVSQKIRSM